MAYHNKTISIYVGRFFVIATRGLNFDLPAKLVKIEVR